MSIKFYFDHNVPRAIATGLRIREVDLLTAYEDNTHELADTDLLDRAHQLERVIFTRDDDFLVEATHRQRHHIPFAGVIYAHQLRVSIGTAITDLELIAKSGYPEDLYNAILFLPL